MNIAANTILILPIPLTLPASAALRAQCVEQVL
jgi:hypothetical protein